MGEERVRPRAHVLRRSDFSWHGSITEPGRVRRFLPVVERSIYFQRLARSRSRPRALEKTVAATGLSTVSVPTALSLAAALIVGAGILTILLDLLPQ
jgi:hypothetical protein